MLPGSGHQSPGLWRHPEDQSWRFNEISHWVELAKLLEEAKFHGIFVADVLGKDPRNTIHSSEYLIDRTIFHRGLRCLQQLARPGQDIWRSVACE